MMDQDELCRRVRDLLQDFMDGRLAGRQCRRVEEHLDTCALCRRELGELQALVTAVRGLRSPVPRPDCWPGLVAGWADQRVAPSRRLSRWHLIPVAAALLVAVLAFLLRPGAPPPATPPAVPVDAYLSQHFIVAGNDTLGHRLVPPLGRREAPRRVYLGDDGP